MDVICRARNTDPLKKIKKLLKQRTAGTKPKVSSLKNASTEVKPKSSSLKNSSLTVVKNTPIITQNKKRKSEASLECPLVKRSKLDHCQAILTKIMKSRWSVPFLCPVDRDASGDYFQVIKHPMDFGTTERKLKQNKYLNNDEFEADVRLVFANATLYHPSTNWVHIYAAKLNKLFGILWMSVKPKLTSDPIPEKNSLQVEVKGRFSDNKIGNLCTIAVKAKVTEVTSQMEEEECQRKKHRELERQRQAARASLEELERSITVDDNLGAMRELEVLMRSRMQVVCHGNGFQSKLGRTKSPLEQLGLFIKPEYQLGYEDDDDLFIQGVVLEDGEIID
ncbi:uncharacterized protein LOC141596246 [Silene latifolia]|uniref:uncharacterized protein LOC141596246 n=1 Tax=Silene latifolia TaxID=37657 RepID=UPI003D785856